MSETGILLGSAFVIMGIAAAVIIIAHNSNYDDSAYIPPCDFNHRGHWEVGVGSANNRYEVEPVVNKYIALGWHDIRAEVHNDGVQDRILADC